MDLTPADLAIAGAAAVAAGFLNAVAGGGTLISFPALTAIGIPAVDANLTNTVALSPGFLSGTLAQRRDMAGQRRRFVRLVPAAALGGLAGGLLLVSTSEEVFVDLVPWLILFAVGLLAIQPRLQARLRDRAERRGSPEGAGSDPWWAPVPIFLASIYGGYFGAGNSVIILAVLGVMLADPLPRLNVVKQGLSFVINVTAAVFFVFSGKVVWAAALVMALGAIAGAAAGGRLASRLQPERFRLLAIAIGLAVAVAYFVK
jgi:uncharacterized membrane protein YfcA